ncbi:hypothetical protein D9757_003109 [Collybiopsis confluens]|uniref:N-acetyltransferase domain-containing protein n=1 Tax=Collybiopsis confluens TaxID=2823264 RepID=A0A8H5HX45_9AGAR|nr:hypothetical protein D9757_003109 [Collybiopsis confluens]
MRCNKDIVLVGRNILLVPYQVKHVPTYHGWMLDEDLRLLTASEPLTLEQEYEMQRKWQADEDKLTFIILAHEGKFSGPEDALPSDTCVSDFPMIGDVNIFFSASRLTVSSSGLHSDDGIQEEEFTAEAEIMIAGIWDKFHTQLGPD